MELYQGVAEEKGLSLELVDAPEIRIEADRDLLFQAVINLIDNAVKYTPSGGAVTMSISTTGPTAEIVVADTGPGISAAMRERVTQRFFRIDSSRSLPGCGLGLSLVEAVAVYHKGGFALEDNEPGVRAVLTLPVKQGR
jgi:signal transduction histidine kinase